MSYTLFLVESPHKAETLTKILGSKYKVMATVGHMMDLDPSKMSVEIDNDFKPIYINNSDKTEVIAKIKAASKKADNIIFASDPDREGEMIAWGTAQILKVKNPVRVTYTEITKTAILEAIKHPREIDMALVDAQKTRRILDRIVGYEISPLVVKVLSIPHLSAGRVQSVVARLIVDKEMEIKEFMSKELPAVFKFSGDFTYEKDILHGILYNSNASDDDEKQSKKDKKGKDKKDKQEKINEDEDDDININDKSIVKIPSLNKAKDLMKLFSTAKFNVNDISEKMTTRNPPPPFSTSSLQQASSNKLGFNVKRTMSAAQNLYEAGYITYLRTDSVNLSEDALKMIGDFVVSKYGKKYHRYVQYKSKSKNTQEAHEAIRPTDINVVDDLKGKKINNDEIKLYSLIWKRAVASQMSPAQIKQINVHIGISNCKQYEFISKSEVVEFAGFLTVYNIEDVEKNETEITTVLNKIPKKKTELFINEIIGKQTYQKPPSRYNDGSLVNKMKPENLNIGRPATTQSIITKIQERGYVRKGDVEGIDKDVMTLTIDSDKKISTKTETIKYGKETNRFIPTELGISVNDFLMKYFTDIMNYQFTSEMEEKLDDIAEGSKKWLKVMKEFYKDFHPTVEKFKIEAVELSKKNKRNLGKHPTTGEDIVTALGLYGPIVKMKRDKKYVSAPIKKPLTIENITLEDAVKLLKYPKSIGMYKENEILLQKGSYGYYLKYNGENMALGETSDINLEDAIKKIQENDAKYLWKGDDEKNIYKILNGEYGVYISVSNKKKTFGRQRARNIKLPKDVDVKKLTLGDIQEIVANWKPRRRYAKKAK